MRRVILFFGVICPFPAIVVAKDGEVPQVRSPGSHLSDSWRSDRGTRRESGLLPGRNDSQLHGVRWVRSRIPFGATLADSGQTRALRQVREYGSNPSHLRD
jgi:hypothetical protein